MTYRGAVIEPKSYRGRSRRWVPEARVRFSHGGVETHHPITSEVGVTCLTEERANEHAVHLAKAWIDLHG
jgi:hypothetical protein